MSQGHFSLRDFRYIWIGGLAFTGLVIILPVVLFAFSDTSTAQADPWAHVPADKVHTDHSALLQGPYATGSEVTRACLTCHEDAAHQVMQTTHWTWQSEPVEVPWRDEPVSVGKANSLNNFCLGVQSNWNGCTRCHSGYGWKDASFDFSVQENVDCLVCHDQSGLYQKAAAGQPAEGVDLVAVAQSVGLPTRNNCGSCHFNGGGGDGVKHGDLDTSLYYPSAELDVHMGQLDFQCTDCHRTTDHQIRGRGLSVSVDNANQAYCTDCHDADLTHDDERITAHTDSVACQTCHIPSGAVRQPTKMEWYWSEAGQDIPDSHDYLRIKGRFVYEEDFTPVYAWNNGLVSRYLLGDPINPAELTYINYPLGTIDDPNALIAPFKVHFATQPYDAVYNYLLQPHLTGEDGYWTTFDWQTALEIGAEAAGMDYSGQYAFAPTEMYWPLSHMVRPADGALGCTDCHGENSRMDWQALGYQGDPMVWGGRNLEK